MNGINVGIAHLHLAGKQVSMFHINPHASKSEVVREKDAAENMFFVSSSTSEATPEEESRRFGLFSENYKVVMEENTKGHAYELEMNKFADLTHEELNSEVFFWYVYKYIYTYI